MTTISELPQETLIEIFSRAPAKTVGKCRCLSKPWRTILSNPQFIKSHLNRQPNTNLILTTPSYTIATVEDENDAVSRPLELPRGDWTWIVGSSGGLVLLFNKEFDGGFLLLNPITLHHIQLPDDYRPQLDLPLNTRGFYRMHGFGYDSSIDDHKIVTVFTYLPRKHSEPNHTFVGVYSVKSGVWKTLDRSTYRHRLCEFDDGVPLNGAIHWLSDMKSSATRPVIAAFDLVDEVFNDIPVPIGAKLETFVHNQLETLGGCLCVLDVDPDYVRTSVWIMKEYGVVESWTKLCSIDIHRGDCGNRYGICRLLRFVGDDEIALVTTKKTLVCYNMKEEVLRDMIVDGVAAAFNDGVTFVPSLVSPAPVAEH